MEATAYSTSPSAAVSAGFTAIDPRAFDEGYSADKLLAHLMKDVLRKKLGGSRAELNQLGTAALTAKASLQNVQKLLGTLDRAEEELQLLNKEVSKKVAQLQLTVSKQESSYKEGIGEAEEARDKLRAAQRELEARMSKVSQVGTRIGDRLQGADAVRTKALDLADLLSHLMRFAQLPESLLDKGPGEGGAAYKAALPPLFWEDAKLRDAAATTRRLMQLTGEAHDSRARSRLVGAADDAADAAGSKGTLMYTTRQLVVYGNWLETRVLVRFDRGMAKGSNRIMAECASIMAMYGVERNIVERYVSLLPVFAAPGPEASIKAPTSDAPAQINAALAPLSTLCTLLLATMQEEAPRMVAVFSNARGALELLVGRIAVEKLATALEALLLPQDSSSSEDEEEEEAPRAAGSGGAAPGGKGKPGAGSIKGSQQQLGQGGKGAQGGAGKPKGGAAAAAVAGSEEEEGSEEETDEEEDEEEEEISEIEEETIEAQMAGVLSRGIDQDEQLAAKKHAHGWGKHHGSKENVGLLHMRLVLLAELFGRCRELGRGLEAACSAAGVPGLDMRVIGDGLFAPYVANYPYPELRWLFLSAQGAAASLKARASGGALSVPFARQLITHSKEALERVEVLSGHNTALLAAHVRLLFHGAGPFEPCEGCLLEMLAQHIIDGVDNSLDQCGIRDPAKIAQAEVTAHLKAAETAAAAAAAAAEAAEAARGKKNAPPPPPAPPAPPPVTAGVAATRAAGFVERRISKVLEAASGAATIMDHLQDHYAASVAPRVSAHIGELALCSGGLSMLIKAVGEAATAVLLRLVETVVIQAEKTLMIEQQRSEFMAGPTDLGVGQATGACLLVCAQLSALQRAATGALSPNNLNALLTEVGLRVHAVLLNHMQQFTFSASGALRWKADVGEYASVMGAFQQPPLADKLESLRGLANLLVVSPEGLLTLVDGALRMEHREALRYMRLRADFATARVEGATLEQLFGGSTAVDQVLLGASS